MRFKPTKRKVLLSLLIGFVISLWNMLRTFFGGYNSLILLVGGTLIIAALIYVVWSIVQKE